MLLLGLLPSMTSFIGWHDPFQLHSCNAYAYNLCWLLRCCVKWWRREIGDKLDLAIIVCAYFRNLDNILGRNCTQATDGCPHRHALLVALQGEAVAFRREAKRARRVMWWKVSGYC